MKRSRFTEEQIIGILREQEAGVSVADLCRKHGMSSATLPSGVALRRFRRLPDRLVEIDDGAAAPLEAPIDLMMFDAFDIRGRYVEDVVASLAREAAIVADLNWLRKVMQETAWLVMPVDLPRIDLAKACLDAARFRKARLAHLVLDGRGEHEDGLVFHPIHNRPSYIVVAVGSRSVFRSYYQNGILTVGHRLPHEAATVELIQRHSPEGAIVGMNDGMLADAAPSFEMTDAAVAAGSSATPSTPDCAKRNRAPRAMPKAARTVAR